MPNMVTFYIQPMDVQQSYVQSVMSFVHMQKSQKENAENTLILHSKETNADDNNSINIEQ